MGQIVYIGSIEKYLELEKDPDKYKKFEIVYDLNKKRKEVKKMTNNDERFTEEEKKVQEFMAKSENKGISYRDAVIEVLDSTEPKPKKEFKGEKPTLREKLIEEYMEKNPKSTYREAVIESLGLLKKEPKKEE